MFNYKEQLESQYGKFEKDKFYQRQCELEKISKRTYLNVLFKPLKMKEYVLFEKIYDCKLPKFLKTFYKMYNGLMLFSHSFRIFGINKYKEADYKTLDLILENAKLDIKNKCPKYADMITFGYYAKYSFFFDKKDGNKIYVIDRTNFEELYIFDSLEKLFDYYIPKLISKYDANGYLISRNSKSLNNFYEDCL